MTTQADYDALLAARRAGIKRVRGPDGREVEYMSAADMDAALALMAAELGITNRRGVFVAVRTSKGL